LSTKGIGEETVACSHKEISLLRDSILCSHPRLQSSDSSFREREERGLTCIREEIKMFCPDNLYRKLMERSQRWAHD